MKNFVKSSFQHIGKNLLLWKEVVHQASLVEMARQRVFTAGIVMLFAYVTIAGRLVDVMLIKRNAQSTHAEVALIAKTFPRGNICDRHGNILATHLVTASIYANPKVIIDPKDAALKLAKLFPEVGYDTFFNRLSSGKGFSWLVRHITPKMQQAVNELGIPGVYLETDYKRVYPYGGLTSHIIGYCGIENEGLAGVEQFYNTRLIESNDTIHLSIDVRIQHIVHDVLTKAIEEFSADGANAMVMDIKTGEMIAMVSLPDFDPNRLNQAKQIGMFNRNTLGVYEPGSTFKIVNTAIALETGRANLNSIFDASAPVRLGRFVITDFKGKNRPLTLAEGLIYSSNIVSIKVAQQFGIHLQKEYFKKFGITKQTQIELPEIGKPLIPSVWKEPTLMTASYGYGIAVTPLQIMSTIGTIINDGNTVQPTLIFQDDMMRRSLEEQSEKNTPVISKRTSESLREMLRMVVKNSQVKGVDVAGYDVFGKTGTALQNKGKGYSGKSRNTFFVGAFPLNDPKVMVVLMLDDAKASAKTYNYATAGWNAAPTAGRIIELIAPVLGIKPSDEEIPFKYVNSEDPSRNFIKTAMHKEG